MKDYEKIINEHINDVMGDKNTSGSGSEQKSFSTDDLIAQLPDIPEEEQKNATKEVLQQLSDELNRKPARQQKKKEEPSKSVHHPGTPKFYMGNIPTESSGSKKSSGKKPQVAAVIILLVLVLVLAFSYICLRGIRFGDGVIADAQDRIADIIPLECRSSGIYMKPKLRWASDDSLSVKEKMMALSWYDPKRQKRYEEYMEKNPDMDYSEVVWQVDMDMDEPNYIESKVIHSKDSDDPLLVVNKHFGFSDKFSKDGLVEIADGYSGTPAASAAFGKMKKAAAKEVVELKICSGYRTIERQENLSEEKKKSEGAKYVNRYVARPCYSEHHTGRAIDMDTTDGSEDFEDTTSYAWLRKNAYKFGFIFRYTDENSEVTGYEPESWHLTYIGERAANTMNALDITSLEEYRVKYVDYRPCEMWNTVPWFWVNSIEDSFSENQ